MIAVATINEKEYTIPMSYKDVSLGKFKAIQDFLYSDQYKDKTEQIVNGKIENEEDILNFMLDFVNYVTDIPLKELKQVRRFTKDDETGIEDLFYAMTFLFAVPVIEEPKPAEVLGDYHFIDKIDLTQAILKDLAFIEYTEANRVITVMNGLKDGKYQMLNILLAIMYRPKEKKGWFGKEVIQEYDSDTIEQRAKEFDAIDMETAWNCLFFFTQLKTKSLQSISKSLEGEVVKAQEG
jgi:hypothetical protein